MTDELQASIQYLRSIYQGSPRIGVVLGSGLGDFAQQIVDPVVIPTKEIPHYPISTVHGHAGKIIFGVIEKNGKRSSELCLFQGRVHLYESNDIHKVVYPIQLAAQLGIQYLIVTNAAGGINRQFDSGTLMLIRDYLNITGESPLRGREGANKSLHNRIEPTFDVDLLDMAKSIAAHLHIAVREGVYCWTKGPTYETAAEIRMMATMGADAVGMSTVPEIIVAHHLGMKILGISCITNMATGISLTKLSHDEVTETANNVKHDFTRLLNEIIFAI